MDIFTYSWIAFVITGFGTLFLIGEILVNMRGIFALLGIAFMTVYFSAYLESGYLILIVIVYIVGLLLIIIDGKLINDGTLATLGLVSMLTAVAIAAPDLYTGLYGILGVLIGGGASFIFLKIFKQRDMWTKIALKDRLTKEAGYSSMNREFEMLVGKHGKTLNDLRPVGTIRIDNNDYSAISNAQWIPKDTNIKIVKVDGTKILVEKVREN